jgi:hypothetical protein
MLGELSFRFGPTRYRGGHHQPEVTAIRRPIAVRVQIGNPAGGQRASEEGAQGEKRIVQLMASPEHALEPGCFEGNRSANSQAAFLREEVSIGSRRLKEKVFIRGLKIVEDLDIVGAIGGNFTCHTLRSWGWGSHLLRSQDQQLRKEWEVVPFSLCLGLRNKDRIRVGPTRSKAEPSHQHRMSLTRDP